MAAPLDLMGISDHPMVILIAWSSLLGLILILPGSMAAAATTFRRHRPDSPQVGPLTADSFFDRPRPEDCPCPRPVQGRRRS